MNVVTSLLSLALGLFTASASQGGFVKAKFEIDGKETKDKFRILLEVNDQIFEPSVSDDGHFLVPVVNINKVDVRLVSGKHNLLFEEVYVTKLRGTLIFKVKEDLSKVESACKPGHKAIAWHSLEFEPDDAEGTEMTVLACD